MPFLNYLYVSHYRSRSGWMGDTAWLSLGGRAGWGHVAGEILGILLMCDFLRLLLSSGRQTH